MSKCLSETVCICIDLAIFIYLYVYSSIFSTIISIYLNYIGHNFAPSQLYLTSELPLTSINRVAFLIYTGSGLAPPENDSDYKSILTIFEIMQACLLPSVSE